MMTKEFTKKHWRNFEFLTGSLFQLEFGLKKNEIVITPMAKDGGKDVVIERDYISRILEHPKIEIWVEAKLRGQKTDIQIKDISGTVIMASNSNITAVYFVTNCFFTPQTIRELLIFREKSGLQITLVDGYHYRNLLLEYQSKIVAEVSTGEDTYIQKDDFLDFLNGLLESLPIEPDNSWDGDFNLVIRQGKIFPNVKYANAIKEETKIELRKVEAVSLSNSFKSIKLNDIKISPILNDQEVQGDISLQLIGEKRNELFTDVINDIRNNNIIVVKGNSGQGKTFFANHVMRKLYQENYSVIFADLHESSVISFTKDFITNLIGVDYFKLLEEEATVVQYLTEYLKIDSNVGAKILDLMRKDRFVDSISVEICLEVLVHIAENHLGRKKLALVVDNLHKSSNDLLGFVKNLSYRLSKVSTPVLAFSVYKTKDSGVMPENQWIQYLDAIIESNNFKSYTLPSLDNQDIQNYITALVPGANDNVIRLVNSNTLKDPFFIKLYVDYLKEKNIIRSADRKYWWLDESSVLLDSSNIRSNNIDTIITSSLKKRLQDRFISEIGTLLFFFNNRIIIEELEQIVGEIDIDKIIQSGIFQISLDGNNLILSFVHDLYYLNFANSLTTQEASLFAARLLIRKTPDFFRNDVLGKLYEHTGDFENSYNAYFKFATEQCNISSFTALLFFEKALDNKLNIAAIHADSISANSEIVTVIFVILGLYDKYNFLSSRKAPQLFNILKKHVDFYQLKPHEETQYYYFLGLKLTKDENFNLAKEHFEKAYEVIRSSKNIPQELVDKVICCVGINLKHIGAKKESIIFFENAIQIWNNDQIKFEQYSNIAAYYLTSDPQTSLEYYWKMEKEFPDKENLHLLIDFAMAYFYMNKTNVAIDYLNRALPLSKKSINLSEEARAENILGVISSRLGRLEVSEAYLDLAVSNGELANNHRWIWRIRANLAQISFYNGREDKAYNLCWSVINHLMRTKDSIIFEVKNITIYSRRFAALKGVLYILFQLEKLNDLISIEEQFSFKELSLFLKNLRLQKNIFFDDSDSNLYNDRYLILG